MIDLETEQRSVTAVVADLDRTKFKPSDLRDEQEKRFESIGELQASYIGGMQELT